MKIQILCDLDGVLADFCSSSQQIHDKEAKPPSKWDYFKDWGINNSQFFEKIHEDHDFWRNLNPYPWKNKLIEEIEGYDPDYKILTSPSQHFSSWGGKYDWIKDHLGIENPNRIIMTANKKLLAGSGRVLIDDNDRNVSQWVSAGGIGILFPQLYNDNMIVVGDRHEFLCRQLKTIQKQWDFYSNPIERTVD